MSFGYTSRTVRGVVLPLCLLALILSPRLAAASDPQPGDTCPAAELAHSFYWDMGPLSAGGTGISYALFCESGTWTSPMMLQANGNVGIGSTSPGASLDVHGGGIQTSINGTDYINRDVVQWYPGGSGMATGTMKITMPKGWSTTMMRVVISGYDYTSTTGAWQVVVSGYNYAGTTSWWNPSAEVYGRPPFSSVRLGYDGTYNVILLGTTSTSWSYPQVNVTEVLTGFNNNSGWASGWTISVVSSESGLSAISTPTMTSWLNNANSMTYSAGNVGIGTTSPSYLLHVNGTAYAVGAAGALSDIRHKSDVKTLPDGALGLVSKLRPVSFQWKDPKDDGMKGEQIGFIAQEVEKVLPSVVLTQNDKDKTKGLKYTEVIPVLAKAIQELKVDNDNLRAANDNETAQIKALTARVNALESARR